MPPQSWASSPSRPVVLPPVAAPPAPTPFWDAVGRGASTGFEDQMFNGNEGGRESQLTTRLANRHRRIEELTGMQIPLSTEFAETFGGARTDWTAVDDPYEPEAAVQANARSVLTPREYEAQVQALLRDRPELKGIPNRTQVEAEASRALSDLRRDANAASANGLGGAAGSFVGAVAASLIDLPNLVAAATTGGIGAGRPLLARMATQGLAGGLTEAAQAPGRAQAAQEIGGPEYSGRETATDILMGGVGGAGFELGGDVLKLGWRAAQGRFSSSADPAERGLADAVDRLFEDEAAIGQAQDFDGARSALARGESLPSVEPERDLSELFSDRSPGEVSGGVRRSQPASADGLQSTTYYGRQIHAGRFDPLSVEVDAARFQYKAEGDAEGVTGRLRGVERWDTTASGKAILFEDTDGRIIVADGHQRRGLARRLAEQGWEDAQLDGYLFRAGDGWSPGEVRVVAALKNIREGSGSTLDAAKLFREAPGALNDRSLPVSGDLIRQARQLAGLSDDAFRAVVNGVIPENFGAVIGEQAGGRPEIHADLVELLRRGEPRGQEGARALIQEGMLDDFLASEGRQLDLFGGLPRESTVIARGRIREAVLAGIRRDEKMHAALVRNADAIESGGNVLARSENEARLALDRAAGEMVSRLALRSGDMGEAFALAATAVTRGETSPGAAAKGLIQRIRAAIAAGERLDEVRAETITPAPPGAAALKAVDAYDQPGGPGQKSQLADKPEDIEAEAGPAGLFDDLSETVSEDRALSVLKACAPGAPV